eukprot:2031843-Amphidinium_carterae.1
MTKTDKNHEKRQRQTAQRKLQTVTFNRAAVIGSSDSDGFVHVSVEDTPPVTSKKQDKQIELLNVRKLMSRCFLAAVALKLEHFAQTISF